MTATAKLVKFLRDEAGYYDGANPDEMHPEPAENYRASADRLEELEAKLAAVEDKLRVTTAALVVTEGLADQWKEYLVEAEAKLAAVTQYTKHDTTCPFNTFRNQIQGECTCGLKEALKI
jgi:hypothetical protein